MLVSATARDLDCVWVLKKYYMSTYLPASMLRENSSGDECSLLEPRRFPGCGQL